MTAVSIPNGGTINLGGRPWPAQSANKPDSLVVDGNVLTFRTRTGENCATINDDNFRVRSEVFSTVGLPQGVKLTTWGTVRRSGPIMPMGWDSDIQFHGDNSLKLSPEWQIGGRIDPSDGKMKVAVDRCFRRYADRGVEQHAPTFWGPVYTYDTDHSYSIDYISSYGYENNPNDPKTWGFLQIIWDGLALRIGDNNATSYFGVTGFYEAAASTGYLKKGKHGGTADSSPVPAGYDCTTIFNNPRVYIHA